MVICVCGKTHEQTVGTIKLTGFHEKPGNKLPANQDDGTCLYCEVTPTRRVKSWLQDIQVHTIFHHSLIP